MVRAYARGQTGAREMKRTRGAGRDRGACKMENNSRASRASEGSKRKRNVERRRRRRRGPTRRTLKRTTTTGTKSGTPVEKSVVFSACKVD